MNQSAQDIFNHVAKHLIKQAAKALEAQNSNSLAVACRYRTADGRSCAVGCLIVRGYTPSLEGQTVFTALQLVDYDGLDENLTPSYDRETLDAALLLIGALALNGVNIKRHSRLVKDLQDVHDSNDVKFWPEELANVAVRHSLDGAVLIEALTQFWIDSHMKTEGVSP